MRSALAAVAATVLLVVPVTATATAAPEPLDATRLGVPSGVSAVLVEAASGQRLAVRDADRRRPVASTVKLVTGLTVVGDLPVGAVVVPGAEVLAVGGASAGVVPGERWTVEDLLAALLLRSGNDAAVALATAVAGDEDAFVARMESTLAALGVEADLASASGLDEGDRLSAAELAVVARAVLAEPRLAVPAARREVVTASGSVLANRNLLLDRVEGATGLKTGYTSAAGWSLVGTATRSGRTLIAVVLGAADEAERLLLVSRLLEHGFAATRVAATSSAATVRTGRGTVTVAADAGPVTVDVGAVPRTAWPAVLDPDAPPLRVAVLVDGAAVADAEVTVTDARTGGAGTAGLGAAAASGVYAALRAAGAAGLLG